MYSAPFEHAAATTDIETALNGAALTHGISLEPDRLAMLTGAAKHVEILNSIGATTGPAFTDVYNDVTVETAAFSERFGTTAAQLDFTPTLEGQDDIIVGATSAHPEHATLFGLKLIHGLQNYVLLAEAGLVEKPAIIFGTTNPEMAIVAEKFGLLSHIAREDPSRPVSETHRIMRQLPKMEVYGSFEDLSERVFSDETKRRELIFTRRLAAKNQAGAVALSTSKA